MKGIVLLCACIFAHMHAMDIDIHLKNKAVKLLRNCKTIRVVKEVRQSRGSHLIIDCDCRFAQTKFKFLKEIIRLEGHVTKCGIKKQPITTNPYAKNMFAAFFKKLSQNEKNALFDYALSRTSYDMLKFLIMLGVQIDAPWAHYKEPYSQYLPIRSTTHGSRIRSSL